jgi:hypothetical protein
MKVFTASLGTFITLVFVFGLAHSISTGFAGFWGGLPFWVIAVFVMTLAVYDFWNETVRQK